MGKVSRVLRWVFGILWTVCVVALVVAVIYVIVNLKTILAIITAGWVIGGM